MDYGASETDISGHDYSNKQSIKQKECGSHEIVAIVVYKKMLASYTKATQPRNLKIPRKNQ